MSLYVPKKAYFRDNIWPYLDQTTFPLFFVRALHHNGLERQIFGPKMPNFGRFWAKNPNFKGRKQNFWYPYIGEPIRYLLRVKNIDRQGSNGPLGTKSAILIFGIKSHFLFWNRDFSSNGHIINTPEGPPKKIFIPKKFSEVGPCSTKLGGTVPATKK